MPSLKEYAQTAKTQADDFGKKAEQWRKDAGIRLERLTKRLSDATNDSAKYEKMAAGIREQLAHIATRADGEGLSAKLEQTLSLMVTAQWERLWIRSDMAFEKSNVEAAQKGLDDAKRRAAAAKELEALGSKLADDLEGLKKAMDSDPLTTLTNAATTALSGSVKTRAESRIKADIPDILLKRAQERRKIEDAWQNVTAIRPTESTEQMNALLDKNGDLKEKVKRTYAKFQAAQDGLRTFVQRGIEQYEQAVALLRRVGDPQVTPLTTDQIRRIKGLKDDGTEDTALKASRKNALDKEKSVLASREDRDDKNRKYEEALIEALSKKKNPEMIAEVVTARTAMEQANSNYEKALNKWQKEYFTYKQAIQRVKDLEAELQIKIQAVLRAKEDPKADQTVKEARRALETAQAEQKTAEADYPKSDHAMLHAWQVAVPDQTWQLVEDFEYATGVLEHLKGLKPEELVKQWTDGEAEYLKVLVASDDSASTLDGLNQEIGRETARLKVIEQVALGRRLSALRGDN